MDEGQSLENFFFAGHLEIFGPAEGSTTPADASSETPLDAYERIRITTYNYSLLLVATYCFTAL